MSDKATFGLIQFLSDLNNDGQADIYGPFTVNDTSASNCKSKYSSWGTEAKQLAAAQGIDLSAYNHIMHIVPNLSSCEWAGVANLGGQNFYIRTGGGDARVISHELGHNLGVRHAAKDTNNDGAHNSSSTSEEYGDYSCFMGIQLRNLNAPHMVQMGVWDRYKQQVVAAKTGTYKIYPLLLDPSTAPGPQVLYLPRADKSRFYYLSFKTSLHYDKSMNASYKTGVSIYTHTPPGYTSPPVSYYVKTLVDAGTFSDAANGITIKQIKKDPADAYVEVQITLTPPAVDPKCQRAQPTLTAPTSPVAAGKNKVTSLSFTLKNNDNADCPATLFGMTTQLAGGYQLTNLGNTVRSQVFNQNFSAPQGSSSFRVYVMNDGVSRDVTVSVADEFQGTHQPVTAKVRIEVDANPPTTPLNLAAQVLSPTSQTDLESL
ncbi:MAG: hypothetical protein H6727_21095 [Myxococcales bacterium]|nr:hypothetical protein [Myxococcales bacterium]